MTLCACRSDLPLLSPVAHLQVGTLSASVVLALALQLCAGAPLASKDPSSGWTNLHAHALRNDPTALEAILSSGFDTDQHTGKRLGISVDTKTDDGKTALYLAAFGNNLRCAQLLIKYGADPGIRSGSGKLPVEVATNPALVDFLVDQKHLIHQDDDTDL